MHSTATDIQCSLLSAPENGSVNADSTQYGGVAMYTCNTGYILVGSVKRTCIENGTWSGTSPHCQRKSIIQESITINDELTL